MDSDKGGFRAPKGTTDLLPPDSWRWQDLTRLAMDDFARAGYAPVQTPIFEHTEVFERGVGADSEVVNKQMYSFEDLGGRSLTLRPEGTAPVMRAVLEHGLHKGALPVKLAYDAVMFRQERPQKGRYRQFSQLGIEAIGSDEPAVDAEVVEVGLRFLTDAGVEVALRLNSIGHLDDSCRTGYLSVLGEYLTTHRDELAEVDAGRIATNPFRTFDSKERATLAVMASAPSIADHLCDPCRTHFEVVGGLLDDLGVAYEVDPRLVRGLDYYTRTAFEYVAGSLGAQNAVGGGGRYDGLSESLGGPPLPGIGFALGVDRILLASASTPESSSRIDVYLVAVTDEARRAAVALAGRLRAKGLGVDLDLMRRAMKGQMKDASRSGARWAVILGDEEMADAKATLKDLNTGEQELVGVDELEEKMS